MTLFPCIDFSESIRAQDIHSFHICKKINIQSYTSVLYAGGVSDTGVN
ncbi:hypothetical protein TFKS16_2469 [Tannerella forsythia KS16]|nr:hypothetical protein TFKS16_2469 [Tannerella forsythia KS16]